MTEEMEKVPQAVQPEEDMEILTGPDQYDPAKYMPEVSRPPEPRNPEDADFQKFQKQFGQGLSFMEAWTAYAKMKALESKSKKSSE